MRRRGGERAGAADRPYARQGGLRALLNSLSARYACPPVPVMAGEDVRYVVPQASTPPRPTGKLHAIAARRATVNEPRFVVGGIDEPAG